MELSLRLMHLSILKCLRFSDHRKIPRNMITPADYLTVLNHTNLQLVSFVHVERCAGEAGVVEVLWLLL